MSENVKTNGSDQQKKIKKSIKELQTIKKDRLEKLKLELKKLDELAKKERINKLQPFLKKLHKLSDSEIDNLKEFLESLFKK